jgi:MFS family permease
MLAHAAVWLQNITVPYLVFEMTGSATWLGVAAVAGQAPALVASPLGGVLADRHSRRGLLLATLVLKAAVTFGLYTLWRWDALELSAMMALLVLSAVAHTVHLACSSAFVPQLVPRRILASAVRLNSIQVNLSRAVGPAVAGWVLAHFGAGAAFATSGFAYLPFAIVLILGRPRRIAPSTHEGTFRAIRSGIAAVLGNRALGIPVLTVAVVSFFGAGIQPLTAGLASDVYAVDAQGFGWLVSSMGISCAVCGVALAVIGDRVARSRSLRIGVLFYAGGVSLAGATDFFALGITGYAFMGVGHVFVYVSCATSMQLHLAEDLRGRVTSLYMTAIFVAMPAGAQLGGFLGDQVGLSAVLVGYGLALATYAMLGGIALRGFTDLDGERSEDGSTLQTDWIARPDEPAAGKAAVD